VYTKPQRLAERAKQDLQRGLFWLAHHSDLRWLYEAYLRVRPDGAPGVDGQTVQDDAAPLGDNLRSLGERAQAGTYWAPPVRRVPIPKGTGGDPRPLGIPTLEDKILQRAVVLVWEAVYEQDFRDCS
jgi:retron-type reverse transcriptase